MRFLRLLMSVSLLALPALAATNEFSVGSLRIRVPAGFEGPTQQTNGPVRLIAFDKPNPGAGGKTLLQMTLLESGPQPQEAPATLRPRELEAYLQTFLSGVSRRRTNFVASPMSSLKIAGNPAVKVQWTGTAAGQDTVGVMYCFALGTQVVSLHTQDFGLEPTPAMKEAIEAFESMRVEPAPRRKR